jgi:hypothetical protein
MMGNDMLSSQISLSDKNSIELTNQEAIKNHLSIIDLDKCIEKLKQYYNTTDDFIISKTQYSSLLKINTNETISDSTSLKIYNINTRNEINMSLCNNTNITYKFPLSENMKKEMNLTAFKILNDSGIDVFNPNSSSFTSVCSTHIDDTTEYDTTLNYRRQNYFQNKSIQCSGTDCKYEGIDENYYVKCACLYQAQPSSPEVFDTVVDYYLQPLSQWNFSLILCYMLVFIPGIVFNIGLYVMIVLLSINTLILLALQLFIKVDIDADINKVIYYDCLFYDKKIMLIEDYFNREQEKLEHIHNKVGDSGKKALKAPFSWNRDTDKANNDILNLNIKPDTNADQKKDEDNVIQHNNFIDGINYNSKSFSKDYEDSGQEANDKSKKVEYNSPITIHDYDELGAMDIIEYDKRKFTKFLADELVMNHSIISLFFKKSLFDPVYIRIMKLIFQVSLQFCTNALLFTDDYIDARALNTQKVYFG